MFEQTVLGLGLLVVYARDDYERSFPSSCGHLQVFVNLVPDCQVLLTSVLFVVPLAV